MTGLLALWLLFAPPGDTGGAETGAAETADAAAVGESDGAPAADAADADTTGDVDATGDTDVDTTGDTGVTIDPAPAPAPLAGVPPAAAPKAPANDPNAPITVTTRLTPDKPHIGDVLTLEVIVAYPADHDVNLPNALDFSPLEMRGDIVVGEVESTGEGLRRRYFIELQYFDVGEAAVPGFPVTWIDPDEQVHTYHVPPLAFVVESLLANESDPQVEADDPPISLEYPNVRLATILYGVAAGGLLMGLLTFLVLRWRRRERPVIVAPPVPAHVKALADLSVLAGEREAMIAAGAYQDFYLRLTEIAKGYLGARFRFEALDRTTEEIQDILRSGAVRLDPLRPDEVVTFLQDCDLVKFARLSPRDEETLEVLAAVREMIERSRVQPAEAPTAAAKSGEARDVPLATRPAEPAASAVPSPELPKQPKQPEQPEQGDSPATEETTP